MAASIERSVKAAAGGGSGERWLRPLQGPVNLVVDHLMPTQVRS